MKRLTFYGMIIILLFSLVQASEGYIMPEEDAVKKEAKTLIKAFETSGIDLMEVNVNSTLQLPNEFYKMEEMEQMKKTMIEALGIKGVIKLVHNQEHYDPYFVAEETITEPTIYINKNEDTGYNQITVSAVDPSGEMTVFILYSSEIENQKESHIIIDIVKNKGYKGIEEIISKQQEVLTKYGDKLETTTTLVGTKDGKLSTDIRKEWVDSIVETIKGKKIEEVMDDYYTSTTVYTKEIPKVMKYDNKKINLQIATRYSEYEDMTYMWIATPLITNTY